MKKRIISIALTVALLFTLIPMAAIPAKAEANFTVSQECVEIIKKWEGFSAKPYWDYKQWTVGYGTRVPDGKLEEYQTHGISKEDAEQQLIEHLNKDGVAVNKFIDKYNLTFTQGMFDALLSLCYNCGGNWLSSSETSTLKTSIVEGWAGTDLLFAFGQWSTAGGETVPALIRRRLAEARMYLEGVYDYNLPSNYSYVRFDPNGGTCEIKTQGYDVNENPEVRAVPTYAGYKFEGWFTDATGGEQITKLDEGVKTYTLYAHWSAAEGEGLPSDSTQETITGTTVNYQRQVATDVLNSFDNPVKGALVVNAHKKDDIVDIVAEYTDTAGTKWGKVKNGGWINLTYTNEIKIDSTPTQSVTITVTANDVNIRKGPGTGYGLNGKANKGDKLTITETATGSGYTWGKCAKGWIALKYTTYDAVSGGNNTDKEENNNTTNPGTTTKVTGTVKLNAGTLNVRSGAGTSNKVVSYYPNGAKVEILEQKTVGSTIWGRTDKGWISLDYVKLDEIVNDDNTNDDNTNDDNTNDDNTNDDNTNDDNTNDDTDNDNTDNGNTDNGNTDNDNTDSGNTDNGNTDSGNTDNDDTDNGNTDNDNTDNGNTDNDNTDNDNTDNDNTDNDNTDNDNTDDDNAGSNVPTITVLNGKVNAIVGHLNVRKEATTQSEIVGRLYAGNSVVIYEKKTVGSVEWGRISSGWICMDYVTVTSQTTTTQKLMGTISTGGSDLRVRSGAGSNYTITAYLTDGSRVEILERKTVNGVEWGRVSKGWIMMQFVKLDSTDNSGSNNNSGNNTGSNTGNTTTTITGTVKVTSGTLNVRAGAGTSYRVVSYLVNGAKVTILETKVVDGRTWGRISNGWVCMDYIK